MSAVTRPRGPLPPRVYWTRRLVLLAVAFALVFGVARLLGGGSGGGTTPSAQPVGAEESSPSSPTTSAASSPAAIATAPTVSSSPTATDTPSAKTSVKSPKATSSTTSSPLPQSSGPCPASDIVATPTIKDKAHAGKAVVFAMSLTTKSSPACDFAVAPDSLVVKITSGSDRVWSTQDCPAAVPTKSVVLRKDTPVSVDVTWSGMRSDSDCTRSTTWAQPGYYHAMAAAFGAAPVDEQFELLKPTRPRVTAKPSPDAKANHNSTKKSTSKTSSKPSKKPGH